MAVAKSSRYGAVYTAKMPYKADGILLAIYVISIHIAMENLDLTTVILLKANDLELKELLLADLQTLRSKQAA
jgi:hypothetical protein